MITKVNNIIPMVVFIAIFGVLLTGCEKDDNTGYATLKVVDGVAISIAPDFTSPITVSDETETVYTYTLTLNKVQQADIRVHVSVVAGTATAGDDFTFTETLTIPMGATSATGTIKILKDELKEESETFTIQVGDGTVANASFTPVSYDFTISNYAGDELTVDLSWSTNVVDVIGDLGLDDDEVIDLRLLIVDPTDESIIGTYDGSSFETYQTLTDQLDDDSYLSDGTYWIAVDIFSTADFGEFSAPITLDLELEFNQEGVINGKKLSFPAVMSNEYICSTYRVYLAEFTKTGSAFTITENLVVPSSLLEGEWKGIDAETPYTPGEASQVSVVQGCDLLIEGLGFGWMENFWGEEIVAGGKAVMTVDEVSKTVNIAEQYYITTVYNGDVQDDYTIVGSGTYDDSGDYPTLIINYEMTNYGTGWGAWCYSNGYIDTPIFQAVLTLDPRKKKVIKATTNLPFNLEEIKPRIK